MSWAVGYLIITTVALMLMKGAGHKEDPDAG